MDFPDFKHPWRPEGCSITYWRKLGYFMWSILTAMIYNFLAMTRRGRIHEPSSALTHDTCRQSINIPCKGDTFAVRNDRAVNGWGFTVRWQLYSTSFSHHLRESELAEHMYITSTPYHTWWDAPDTISSCLSVGAHYLLRGTSSGAASILTSPENTEPLHITTVNMTDEPNRCWMSRSHWCRCPVSLLLFWLICVIYHRIMPQCVRRESICRFHSAVTSFGRFPETQMSC